MNSYIDSNGKEKLMCPICNQKGWVRLGKHLRAVHKINSKEFLQKYPDCLIVTTEFSKARSDQINEQWKDPDFKKVQKQNGSNQLRRLHQDKDWEHNLVLKASESRSRKWREDPEFAKYMNDQLNAGKYEWLKNPDNYKSVQEKARIEMLQEWESNEEFRRRSRQRFLITYTRKDGLEVNMRSRWEVRLAEFLDDADIDWKYESLRLRYYLNKEVSHHIYIPDFYVKDLNLVIEVKPSHFLDDPVVIAKKEAVIKEGYNFAFITECELWDHDKLKTIFNVN